MSDICHDPTLGRLLPEYELGLLSSEQVELFEQHLMVCDHCFTQVEQFAPAAAHLRTKPYRNVVAKAGAEPEKVSLLRRISTWMWPRGGPWLKPAVALVIIVLLLPFAWEGYRDDGGSSVTVGTAVEIALIRTRSESPPTIEVPQQSDLVVRFGFDPVTADQPLKVQLSGPGGRLLFTGEDFQLDAQLTGRLTVPSKQVTAGAYLLVIRDPSHTGPLAVDSLSFRVVRPGVE